MAPVPPGMTPRKRARERNRERQRRFRARKKERKVQEAANHSAISASEPFPWSSDEQSSEISLLHVDRRTVSLPADIDNRREADIAGASTSNTQVRDETVQVRPQVRAPELRIRVQEANSEEDMDIAPLLPAGQPLPVAGIGVQEGGAVEEVEVETRNATWLARELTGIKCFGNISDTSLEKLTRLFVDNVDAISAMKRRGEITGSYRHSIRKRLNIWQPTFKCAIKFVDLDGEDPDLPQYLDDLTAIPRQYLNPTLGKHYRVQRTEAYTSLADIKKHYKETHPRMDAEALRNAFRSTAVGIDGVREANSGSRTLVVVSVMFAGCPFVWRIYNPYKGGGGCKPTVEEYLG